MRISDWSSDVCSSDLAHLRRTRPRGGDRGLVLPALRLGPRAVHARQFRGEVADGEVETATIKDRSHEVRGELRDGTEYKVSYPSEFADELTIELSEARPAIEIETDQQQESIWVSLLFSILPLLLLFGLFLFFLNRSEERRVGKECVST